MPTLTIPNVPDSVMKRLEALAHRQGCTLEVEARLCLQKILSETKVPIAEEEEKTIPERVRVRRESLSVPPLTEEFLQMDKNLGRP